MAKDYSWIGKGKVFMGEWGSGALYPVGNASELSVSAEEETKTQIDFTSPGGGSRNSISRITRINGSLKVYDLSPTHLARAVRGSIDTQAATPVANETVTAYSGALAEFAKTPDLSQTITVVGYVLGTDYVLNAAGIEILETGSIVDDTDLDVSYTPVASSIVQALTETAKEYRLVFAGVNEARSGKAGILRVHRCTMSPVEGMSLIADDFAELSTTVELINDPTKIGAGVSPYFTFDIEE